jgi:O-antigen/teichoic acid export membrane protein
MTLLWTLVIPRAIGPAGMGLLVTAWAATGIMAVLSGLGTRTFLVKEIAANPQTAPSLLGTALVLRLILLVPAVASMVLFAALAGFSREENLVIYLVTGATALTLLAEPLQAGFQAIERMEYLAYGDVANKVVQSLGGIVLVLIGFRVIALCVLWLIVMAAVLVLNLWWMRRFLRIDLGVGVRAIGSLLRDSAAYWAFGLFYMIYLWIDTVMLSLMTRAEVVGWYGVPTKLFTTLMFIPVIISTAWLPRLAIAFKDGAERLRVVSRTPVEIVIILALPVSVGTALIAGPLIRLLYGAEFMPSAPVLAILAFTCIPMYFNIMANQVLIASNRQFIWTWVLAGATVVNPALNFVLIQYFEAHGRNGAIGAAVSLLLTEILIALAGVVVVRGIIDRRTLFRLARAALAALGMAAVVTAVARFGLVAQVALGAVTFVTLGSLLRVATADEIEELRRIAGRIGGRLTRRTAA